MRKNKHMVAPSLLAADFANLVEAIEIVNSSEADMLHLDVMDGHFVPNISFGIPVIRDVHKHCKKPLDVHLMIEEPDRYIEKFREVGADHIIVHLEACTHLHRTIQHIKATGAKAGVALNPHTSVTLLEDILEDVDIVLLMSVNPGFGGQKFIYQTIPKIRKLHDMLSARNLGALISIDGGVAMQNAESILQAGADILIAGSSVFKADDPNDAVRRLKQIGSEAVPV